MYRGVRYFIGAIFLITGLSFLAVTAVLAWEFNELDWPGLAAFYSHLFVFFPTFGIVALAAFYLPACVFLDMYWRHVPFGRLRFIIGFVVVVAVSASVSALLRQSSERSIFEIAPAVLAADRGVACDKDMHCQRLPILKAVDNVRMVSQKRIGLSDLARNCEGDPLTEDPADRLKRQRFCFASTLYSDKAKRISDLECCKVQVSMLAEVNGHYAKPQQRSLTGIVHGYLLPLNVFFLVIMLVISLMLAFRRKELELHYPQYLGGIERGVLIGAAALVIYPIMVQAFLQSANLVYGSETPGGFRSIAPLITLGFGGFALTLLFYFHRRRNQEMQNLARIGGIVGSAVAIIKYEQIIDVFVRIFGSGAGLINLAVLVLLAFAGLIVLFVKTNREIEGLLPVDEELLTGFAIDVIDGQMPK